MTNYIYIYIRGLFFIVIGALFIGCGSSDSSSSETTTTKSGIDFKVVSAKALKNSSEVTDSNTYEGNETLSLQVKIENNGDKTPVSDDDIYSYIIKVTSDTGKVTISSGTIKLIGLSSSSKGDTWEQPVSTNYRVKQTDKSYEFIFNDENFNNKFDDIDYSNNKIAINNVYLCKPNLVFDSSGIFFYSQDSAGGISGINSDTTVAYDPKLSYGHVFPLKNDSNCNFYGDLVLNVKNTPFTYNKKDNFDITATREIASGDTVSPGGISLKAGDTALTKKGYSVTFTITNKGISTANTATKTLTIN